MSKPTVQELIAESACYLSCVPAGMQLPLVIDLLARLESILTPGAIMDRGMLLMINNAATQGITAAPSILTGWTSSAMLVGVTANAAAGTLTVSKTGVYLVHCNLDADTTTSSTIFGEIYLDSISTGIKMHVDLAANEGHHAMSMTGILSIAAGQVVSMKVNAGGNETLNVEEGQLVLIQQPN